MDRWCRSARHYHQSKSRRAGAKVDSDRLLASQMLRWGALAQVGYVACIGLQFEQSAPSWTLLVLLSGAAFAMWFGSRVAWMASRLIWALASAVLIYAFAGAVLVDVWVGAGWSAAAVHGFDALVWLAPPLVLYLMLSSSVLRKRFAAR